MKQVLFAFVSGLLSVFAQQETPVVHEEMTVNLVELDVKVQNLGGTYLSGLDQKGFKVYENGVLQKISHFEEVDLMQLPESETEEYQSKVMILLDFQNSAFQDMRKVFKDLRDYFDTTYDGKSLIGLAINSGGIAEVLPFTNKVDRILTGIDTAQKLFQKALYKDNTYQRMTVTGNGDVLAGSLPSSLDRHQLEMYFRDQITILGQFLNYVGTYTGKKSIVMISGPWGRGEPDDGESSVNNDNILSVRDIQTSCLFNKISINVISLTHPESSIERTRALRRNVSVFDRTIELASMSSGSFKKPANSMIESSLADTVDRVGRFYRIRYYSSLNKNEYRKIRVKVKGFGKMVNTLSGYYPGVQKVASTKVNSEANLTEQKNLQLQLMTNWMAWSKKSRKEKSSFYAIGYRVYGNNGQLVSEHVSTGEVVAPKGVYPVLKQNIVLDLQNNDKPTKIQAIVTDLTSGRKVEINTLNTDI